MDEDSYDKLVSRLTRTAHVSVGNSADAVWVVRHYTGSGKVIEVYVLRGQKFLGRFEVQEQATFDAAWSPAKDSNPITESELALLRKARMSLLSMVDKLWPGGTNE